MNRGRGRGTSTGLIQCLELNDGCARGNTFFTINRRSNYRISRCNYRLFILFLWNFWTTRVPTVLFRLIYVRRQLLLRVNVTNTASPGLWWHCRRRVKTEGPVYLIPPSVWPRVLGRHLFGSLLSSELHLRRQHLMALREKRWRPKTKWLRFMTYCLVWRLRGSISLPGVTAATKTSSDI